MIKLIINVAAAFLGLAIFLVITNTPWGKKNARHAYAIAAASLLAAVLIGALISTIIGRILQ